MNVRLEKRKGVRAGRIDDSQEGNDEREVIWRGTG